MEVNTIIDTFLEIQMRDNLTVQDVPVRSAGEYTYQADNKQTESDNVLVIDRNLKGVDYQLAKCCNPIYGDQILQHQPGIYLGEDANGAFTGFEGLSGKITIKKLNSQTISRNCSSGGIRKMAHPGSAMFFFNVQKMAGW